MFEVRGPSFCHNSKHHKEDSLFTSVNFTLQTKLAEVVTVELPLLTQTFHHYNEHKAASTRLIKQTCSKSEGSVSVIIQDIGRIARFTLPTEVAETLK